MKKNRIVGFLLSLALSLVAGAREAKDTMNAPAPALPGRYADPQRLLHHLLLTTTR